MRFLGLFEVGELRGDDGGADAGDSWFIGASAVDGSDEVSASLDAAESSSESSSISA